MCHPTDIPRLCIHVFIRLILANVKTLITCAVFDQSGIDLSEQMLHLKYVPERHTKGTCYICPLYCCYKLQDAELFSDLTRS